MGCTLHFKRSLIQYEFAYKEMRQQQILVDVLLRHSDVDENKLATLLNISSAEVSALCAGTYDLSSKQAEDLAQLFLNFFGSLFLRECTFIRNFCA